MPEINELAEIDPSDVTDDDFLVVYDTSAPTGSKAKRVTRLDLMKDFARTGEDVEFGTVDANEINAPTGAIDNLTVSELTMGATVTRLLHSVQSVTVATLATLATEVQSKAISGAIVGDFVVLQAAGLPVGLILVGEVSASNTVQIKAVNATGSSISSATYSVSVLLIRAS
jgi:hypothetical protein